jgi:hypothetical protein
VRHPLVRKIGFTGSTAVGSSIMEMASKDVKRVSLELGGKSPNIIFADADWEQAARTSPMSVFANTGQDCCARSRVFVERRIFKKFVEAFVEATAAIVVGNPAKAATQVGPLVSRRSGKWWRVFWPARGNCGANSCAAASDCSRRDIISAPPWCSAAKLPTKFGVKKFLARSCASGLHQRGGKCWRKSTTRPTV